MTVDLRLAIASLFIVGCAAPAATAVPPAMTPTATAYVTPSASPTVPPTATPTPVSSPTAPPVTPTPAPSVTSEFVDLLISYAHPTLQATCHEVSQLHVTELASVTCGTADLPFNYSLFANVADMQAAYDDDVATAETPPVPDGTCQEGNFEGIYAFEDGRSGRYNCREDVSPSTNYRVLEWTEENTLVIGSTSSPTDLHTWDDLYNFFVDMGGPYAND